MKSVAGFAAVLSVVTITPGFADFINEPAESGLSAVNITGVARNPSTGRYAITGPVFDASGRQLQIGSGNVTGGVASLTLNNQVGDYDVVGITGLGLTFVGDTSAGALTIDGIGAFIEADTTWFGLQNEATVNILNGGRYSGERTFLALDSFDGTPPGNVSVTVDGDGSTLETETVSIGSSEVPTTASAELIVSDGGLLSAAPTSGETYSNGQIYVGTDSGTQNDRLVITGNGSRAEATDFIGVLSLAGSDRIDVLDGGALATTGIDGADIWVGGYEAPAEMLVSGAGSTATSTGDIVVGFTRFVSWDDPENYVGANYGHHDGVISVENGGSLSATGDIIVDNSSAFTVTSGTIVGDPVSAELVVGSGGTVSASSVIVNEGGRLSGAGGTIAADVVLNGGTLAPGASPGVLTVEGNLDLFDALVQIEIGGSGLGEYDQLNVFGNLFADAGTTFQFSLFDDYTLQAGDVFDIFNVDGALDFSSAMFDFSGLGDGVQTSFFSNDNESFALRIDSVGGDPLSPVPLPAAGWLLLTAFGGLGLAARRRKAV